MNQPTALKQNGNTASIAVLPYLISPNSENSSSFYTILNDFTQLTIMKGLTLFLNDIRAFRQSSVFRNDLDQSHEENLLDLMITGILWNEYSGCYQNLSPAWRSVFSRLFILRSHSRLFKTTADTLRSRLAERFLSGPVREKESITIDRLKALTCWLTATGEFSHEAARLSLWTQYFETQTVDDQIRIFQLIDQFSGWFKIEAEKHLGQYTRGVESFLANHQENYSGREDYFFTGRTEVEYHLNMVGATIMNRSLKAGFDKTSRKILLLPSCLIRNHNCKAVSINHVSVCQKCTFGCRISTIARSIGQNEAEIVIVHHTSDFSKALKQWSLQNQIGIIGTACVLNLLEGGFEMKKHRIPSQCLFLGHSCCPKHWGTGIPAAHIDPDQLHVVLN